MISLGRNRCLALQSLVLKASGSSNTELLVTIGVSMALAVQGTYCEGFGLRSNDSDNWTAVSGFVVVVVEGAQL